MELGGYAIEGELGRGGVGIVYRARSRDGRVVALKLLADVDVETRERFERERRVLASLGEAQGFVPFLDSGQSARGPFAVMPLIPGGTLRERLRGGPLDAGQTLALGRAIAAAVGHAHALGIVHRDLKPENILFTAEGRPLVADLGLAKRVHGTSASIGSISRSGELGGTPGYMAAEQIADAKRAGPPADVFAIGVILYECLAGRRPFDGPTMLDTLMAVEAGKFARLGRIAPPPFVRAIERSLDRDPARRFTDARALADELARLDTDRRGRSRAPAAIASFIIIIAGAALAVRAHWPRTPALAPPTQPPSLPPKPKPTIAPVATPAAPPRPVESAATHAARAEALQKQHLYREAIAALTSAIALEPDRGAFYSRRAGFYMAVADAERALADCDRAIALDPTLAYAFANRAQLRIGTGDKDGSLADATRAIELDERIAAAWATKSVGLLLREDVAGARAAIDRAIALDPRVPWFLKIRGRLELDAKDYRAALEDVRVALEVDPDDAETVELEAVARSALGDPRLVATLRRLLEVAPDHPHKAELAAKIAELEKK